MNANAYITRQEEQAARDLAKVEALARQPVAKLREVSELEDFYSDPMDPEESPYGDAVGPCSDKANALRIVKHFGDQLLFVDGIGWHVWGPPWRYDRLAAHRIFQSVSGIVQAEAAALHQQPFVSGAALRQKESRSGDLTRWAVTSEHVKRIGACMELAQAWLNCRVEDLDANPMLLGLPSGVLELDTGIHRDHQQSDRITKVAGADFDLGAKAPTWERFITQIMGGDAELTDFMQQLAGYALSGVRGEHILPITWGSGANGKSTFLSALQHALGDYAMSAAPGLLIRQNGNEHPTALADLHGQRLVVVSESGEMGKLNEEQIKAMTGGDRIRARKMRQDSFEFDPTHLLFLQTNHKPRVSGNDEGIWRRIRLIPFTVTVPPDKRDPKLPEKLRDEAAGILLWAYRGWQRYRANGRLPEPEKVKAATAEYRSASDLLGAFLDECTTIGEGFSVPMDTLFRAYQAWRESNGERPGTKHEFGQKLDERGFPSFKSGDHRKRRGLRLNPTEQERQRGQHWGD